MRHLYIVLIFIGLSTNILSANDWGRTGHRATAAVAERYLTSKTKKEIKKVLG